MTTGKRNRQRGAEGEREWCAVLRKYGYAEAARNLGQSRDGGGDVIAPPFLWEVKRRKSVGAVRFMEQAGRAAITAFLDGHLVQYPAVALREDPKLPGVSRQWYVMLKAEDFFEMIGREK